MNRHLRYRKVQSHTATVGAVPRQPTPLTVIWNRTEETN